MEESYEKNAVTSPRPASLPNLTQHPRRDRVGDWERATSLALATDDAIDPATVEDFYELGPRSHVTDQDAQVQDTNIKVPRSRRRGLFARATLLAEIRDPYRYSNVIKWFIVFTVAYASAAGPMGSAILFPSLSQIAAELRTTPAIVNLTVALYMLSMAISPLWWSPLSELFGRRSVYLVSFVLFIVFAILSAVSTSIVMLTVMRILCGGAIASVQAMGAATIADIWKPIERGKAIGFFYLGPLCGPLFAPVIGGVLAQKWQWRATMWFLAIYGGSTFLLILLALPETLPRTSNVAEPADEEVGGDQFPTSLPHSVISRASTGKAVRPSAVKCIKILRVFFVEPLEIILYLRFPAVLLTVYYASITYGSLYVLNISIQTSFEKPPYSFSTLIVGLLYIPASLGYVIASIGSGKWMDSIMAREARKAGRLDENGLPVCRPEDRMRENAWLGAIFYPLALIVYGWAVQKGIHWIVPVCSDRGWDGRGLMTTDSSVLVTR